MNRIVTGKLNTIKKELEKATAIWNGGRPSLNIAVESTRNKVVLIGPAGTRRWTLKLN